MKKQFYLSLIGLAAVSMATGQHAVEVEAPALKNNFNTASKTYTPNQKDFENPLYESDFSEDLGDAWIVDNENAPPAEEDNWVIGTDVPDGPFAIAGINSPTAENGYAMFDSDGYCVNYEFPYPGQNAWIQTATAVELPAENVSVQFSTFYRAFQGQCFFEFSEDGSIWNSTELFLDIEGNDATGNGELFTFFVPNLSGVDEAFFRFRYVGACDYAWMIDDFKVAATPEFDIRMTDAWYDEYILLGGEEDPILDYYDNMEYSEYLQGHVRPLTFVSEVENLGTSALTGVTMEVTVTTPSGDQTFTSDGTTVEPFEFATLTIPDVTLDAFANGGELGDYTVDFSVFVAEAEPDLSNNFVSPKSFTVNDMYMANDRGTIPGGATSTADDCTWGSQFVYKEPVTVNYLSFALIETATFESAEGETTIINTTPGELLYLNIQKGSVLEEDGPGNEMELLFGDDEIEYVIDEIDISEPGELNWIIIPLPSSVTLDANEIYQAEITLPIVGSDYCLIAQVSQQEELAGTLLTPDDLSTGPQGWFTLGTDAPALRMGTSESINTRNMESLSFNMAQNFPNPVANGSTRISWELRKAAENITFTITDNTGKTIYQKDLGDRPAGIQEDIILDGLNLAAGVYQYGLKVGNERMVRKMVIAK